MIILLYTWNNDSIINAKAVPSQISVIKKIRRRKKYTFKLLLETSRK